MQTHTHTHTYTHTHTHTQHARLATSPALGSASICQFPVSNKMDGWRMEIMVETQPHTLASFYCERAPLHSVCDHPYAERATSPTLFHTSFSYHPPRVSPFSKYKYIRKIYSLCIYNIFRRRRIVKNTLQLFPFLI